jgi:serine/threonine protein kinase
MEFPHRRGEFSVLQKIGEGGMAEVFLAERGGDEGFRSRVALKRLHTSFGADEYFIRQLVQEAKLLGQLQHNNIVRVHDLRKIDDEYFIVMEYIDGIDLAQAIYVHQQHSLRFPLSIFFHVALSLCEALEFAHTAVDLEGRPIQLIHRDIKPSNVLIHQRGVVKLTDFGIAYVGDSSNTGSVVKGTSNYMSPEQAGGEQKLKPSSDIFSLGAVFWEMLTLDRLVDGTNYLSVIHGIRELNVGLKDISKRGIEPGLRMILLRMLARKRDLRYQNMGLVLKDLRFVADQMKVDLSPTHLRQYMAKITNLAREAPVDPGQTLAGRGQASPQVAVSSPAGEEPTQEVEFVSLTPESSLVTPPRGSAIIPSEDRLAERSGSMQRADLASSEADTAVIAVDPDLDFEPAADAEVAVDPEEPRPPPAVARGEQATEEMLTERPALAPGVAPRPVSRGGRGSRKPRRSTMTYLGLFVVALVLAAAMGALIAVLLVEGG